MATALVYQLKLSIYGLRLGWPSRMTPDAVRQKPAMRVGHGFMAVLAVMTNAATVNRAPATMQLQPKALMIR